MHNIGNTINNNKLKDEISCLYTIIINYNEIYPYISSKNINKDKFISNMNKIIDNTTNHVQQLKKITSKFFTNIRNNINQTTINCIHCNYKNSYFISIYIYLF